jgi:protein-S-isoprenylcysteine O-methyltransferase Ste14
VVFFGSTYFHTQLMIRVFNTVFLVFLIIEGATACFSLINSIKSSKESKKNDRGSMLLIMAGIFVSVLSSPLLILAVPYILPGPVFWVGIFASLLGIAVRVASILTLRRFFTFSVQVGKEQKLVQDGPYRFLRHPAYTGSILTLLGIALCFRSPLGIAVTAVAAAVVYGYRIRVEEREMENSFGDSYRTYEQQTWRVLPFIW